MWTWRNFAVLFLLSVLANTAVYGPTAAQDADNLVALNQQVERLYQRSMNVVALPLARRAVALAEQRGLEDAVLANTLCNLAAIYKTLGRDGEAEPLYRRALEVRKKILPADDSNISSVIIRLVEVYRALNRSSDAQSLLDHWLMLRP
jgi:tetratricopeptide (TPR) repeat protein